MRYYRLLKAVLIGGNVVLTGQPVELGPDWQLLIGAPPIEALAQGARLLIDVTHLRPAGAALPGALEARLPTGCAQARVSASGGPSIELRSTGVEISAGSANLALYPASALPLGVLLTRIEVRSECEIGTTTISWVSFKF